MSAWRKVSDLRWVRSDGAAVKWDDSSPHPNPAKPSARMWTAWEPDPSQRAISREIGRTRRRPNGTTYRFSAPRRFKTPEAAMRRVDGLFPL